MERCTMASEASLSSTVHPCIAATCAIPAPMIPLPMIPTRTISLSLECRGAFLEKCHNTFSMIRGQRGAMLRERLRVEHPIQIGVQRAVQESLGEANGPGRHLGK